MRARPRTAGTSGLLLAAVAAMAGVATPGGAQDFPISSALPAESRQFDFWVGEWDVNLRVLQDDLTWEDSHSSVAKIYPILSGKAILELWSEDRVDGIKGYSLRHFDTARDEWVLWLNWPGQNRSGSSSLAGSFRHERGEFFSAAQDQDGTETISRYSFSDIGSESLRWDDAFSSDGGKTWTNRWIMEFSRTASKPSLVAEGGPAHSYHAGDRCNADEFRKYEFMSGRKDGQVEAGGSGPVTITGYQVLDGCAVLTFAGPGSDPERAWGFSHITWNTFAERYELTTVTSQANTPVRVFYSRDDSELIFYEQSETDGPVDRFRIEENSDGSVTWAHETPAGDGWSPVWQGRVGGH